MQRYTPLFSSILDSSVWDLPLHVRVLWITMLARQDRDHVVRCTTYALARDSRLTMEQVEDGLRILSEPDTVRPGQENEGRRIERVEEGWLVLNGGKYQKEMMRINRREYQRQYAIARRQRLKEDKQAVSEANQKGLDIEMPRSQPEVERAQMRAQTIEDVVIRPEVHPTA